MVISGHQSSYLPWYGFFEKLSKADVFAIHDVGKYEKGGYINRNQIKTSQGPIWLTVPLLIKGNRDTPIKDLKIDNSQNWQRHHWKTINVNYSKAKYFNQYKDFFGDLYHTNWEYLHDFNMSFINFIIGEINLKAKLCFTSNMECRHKQKSDFVLSLCKELQTDTYFSGRLGKNYLIEKDFVLEGITINYQQIRNIRYEQLYDNFIPNLSIIDILFNCGSIKTEQIIKGDENIYERTSICGSP